MFKHPAISLCVVGAQENLRPFLNYLQTIQPIQLTNSPTLPADLTSFDVILTADSSALTAKDAALRAFVENGGGWLGLVTPDARPLPPTLGVTRAAPGITAELRILFQDPDHPIATRLDEAIYLTTPFQPLQPAADDVETLLYADWRYAHHAMLTLRSVGSGRTACTTLQAFADGRLQQILYRVIRDLAERPHGRTLGVGLLGYAPSVGQLHGLGAAETPGLEMRAACDLNPERLAQAAADFPGLTLYEDAADLAADPAVDIVIVTTPPNSHAVLSIQMMNAGKHVVCEKPLALNQAETAAMAAAAAENGVHLSCHQNRRWDIDYLAVKQALEEGLLGELFYGELFVGDFHHPCGFWHSHDAVSGGTTYDWGAHYLDWVVGLIPDRVTAVIGTRQNRVWHDVTNADQERIQVRFANGQEIDFIHSDIAAARKPKWYLLGTEGALVGDWRDVTEYQIDPVNYFEQHDIPPTEMPPDLTLHKRHRSGQIVPQKIAVPARLPYQFHRNLADHMLTGEPIVAPLAQSIRVVAIMEAASRSAANGGAVEPLDV